MEFIDRTSQNPNRFKIIYEDSGVSSFATIELADNPVENGTPLNRASFETMQDDLLSGEKGIHSVKAGGTGADNKEDALLNLGAAPAKYHNIFTFDALGQIGLADSDMSATDLVVNIKKISEAIASRLKYSSSAFIFSYFTSKETAPNLNNSIRNRINNDLGASYADWVNTRIEIKGTGQTSNGTKNIVITFDTGNTTNVYEGCFNRAEGDSSYTLSTFIETALTKFNKPLLTGKVLYSGNSTKIYGTKGYNLFAIKAQFNHGAEFRVNGMVLVYAEYNEYTRNLIGTNGVFAVDVSINTNTNDFTVNSVSYNNDSAYITDVIGVM